MGTTLTRVPVYHHTYGTPNGSERRVRLACEIRPSRADDVPWRPPLATRRMSSGPHASARPDRSRRRPCAPTPARMPAEKRPPDETLRVRRRTRSAVLRSARSAAGATRSGAAGPRPTCPARMPSRSANGPPAGARGQLKYPLPCRPRDGRRIGASGVLRGEQRIPKLRQQATLEFATFRPPSQLPAGKLNCTAPVLPPSQAMGRGLPYLRRAGKGARPSGEGRTADPTADGGARRQRPDPSGWCSRRYP